MSARQVNIAEILTRYVSGYFPLYDLEGEFFWERLSIRAMIPVNPDTAARARRLARRGRHRFEIRHNTVTWDVVTLLQREDIKRNSWVQEEVVKIYAALHAARLLRTVEAWDTQGNLAGALLGIDLPGTFIAETMFGLVPEASKICLCRLVEDCFHEGREIIDVQTPHNLDEWGLPREDASRTTPHPCVRIGEIYLPISVYMRAFVAAWKRAFNGGIEEWLERARQ